MAADNSPSWLKMARIASASASVTRNIPIAWRCAPRPTSASPPVKDIGLTRAAGVVCPGDGTLTTTSVLAATGELDHPSIASYNHHGFARKSYRADQPKARFLTLSHRPTQPQVAASLQRWVNPPDISIIPKPYNTQKPKICATLALVVLISRHIAPPSEPCHG
jgi:hypothetical protein